MSRTLQVLIAIGFISTLAVGFSWQDTWATSAHSNAVNIKPFLIPDTIENLSWRNEAKSPLAIPLNQPSTNVNAPSDSEFQRISASARIQKGQPTTATLTLEGDWRDRIINASKFADTPKKGLLLAIEGLVLPAEPGVEARVFVNKPDADAMTPITDPHYAGRYILGTVEQGSRPLDFVLDLNPVLRRLVPRPKDQLKITVIGVANHEGKESPIPVHFQQAAVILDD